MKPAPFLYVAAHSQAAALATKSEHGDDARFLAGGQSLVPAMNFRLARPAIVIDINGLTPLDYVRRDGLMLRIGALTRYRALERSDLVNRHAPLLAEALPHVAHPQIRNRGTLGGNLAHADPASELPAVVLALDGRLRAQSVNGERWIEARSFFSSALTTALRADEMLIEIELPDLPPRTGACFLEIARRRGDYAMMGVACTITLGDAGECVSARLAFCNAGETPMLTPQAAQILVGTRITDQHMRDAAAQAQREIDPLGSVNASREFQRHLAGILTRRALRIALRRATEHAN